MHNFFSVYFGRTRRSTCHSHRDRKRGALFLNFYSRFLGDLKKMWRISNENEKFLLTRRERE